MLTDAEKRKRAEARKLTVKPAARKTAAKKAPKRKSSKPAAVAFAPDGQKSPASPADWPFGTEPKAPEKPAEPDPQEDGEPVVSGDTPLEFLQAVYKETRLKLNVRLQAAALAAPFMHAKPAPVGKKEQRQEAAKATSRFKPTGAPPRLVHSNR